MTFRPPQRQPSTHSTSTYHTARSNVGNHLHYQPTPLSSISSQLRRQESKHQVSEYSPQLSHSTPLPTSFDQLIPLSGNKPKLNTTLPKRLSTKPTKSGNYICTGVPNEEPLSHYVLIPIGKTGDGKSSLLNALFGYQEFTAKPTPKSVTDAVVERTGVWTVDKTNHVVTVADTPGFADSGGRDFTAAIQNYIMDVSDRVGIDAFLLVFSLKSTHVMSVLRAFVDLMKDMGPTNWWDHVILVFTRVDYTKERQTDMVHAKKYIQEILREEIKTTFNLETPPPAVFVSAKRYQCPLLLGSDDCDCVEVKFYQNERMRNLKETIAKCSERGRWRASKKQTTTTTTATTTTTSVTLNDNFDQQQPYSGNHRHSQPQIYSHSQHQIHPHSHSLHQSPSHSYPYPRHQPPTHYP